VAFELQNGALLDSLAPRRFELLRLGTSIYIRAAFLCFCEYTRVCVCMFAFKLQNGALLDSLAPRRFELLRLGTSIYIYIFVCARVIFVC